MTKYYDQCPKCGLDDFEKDDEHCLHCGEWLGIPESEPTKPGLGSTPVSVSET